MISFDHSKRITKNHALWIPMRGAFGRSRAFSLIEIVVVLAILAIVSSVALVSYGSYRRTLSVRSTAQQVSTLFAAARSNAINTNSPYSATIALNRTRQSFWLDEMDATGANVIRPKVTSVSYPADYVVIEDVLLTPGGTPQHAVAGNDTLIRVVFYPDGRGTYAVIHIRREFDDTASTSAYTSVRVFAATGACKTFPNAYITE